MFHDEKQRALLELVKLELRGMTQREMAEFSGISEGRISQIVASAEYIRAKEEYVTATVAEAESRDLSWNKIEELALKNVESHLKYSRDGEYSLRAAAVANRATRRSPIQPGALSQNGKAIQVIFTQNTIKLIQGGEVKTDGPTPVQAEVAQLVETEGNFKRQNIPTPDRVEAIFSKEVEGQVSRKMGHDYDALVSGLSNLFKTGTS